jgi:hypothetical protein
MEQQMEFNIEDAIDSMMTFSQYDRAYEENNGVVIYPEPQPKRKQRASTNQRAKSACITAKRIGTTFKITQRHNQAQARIMESLIRIHSEIRNMNRCRTLQRAWPNINSVTLSSTMTELSRAASHVILAAAHITQEDETTEEWDDNEYRCNTPIVL